MGKGTLSPDGKFLWTGEEWVPAPPGMEDAGISTDATESPQPGLPFRSAAPAPRSAPPPSTSSSREEYSTQQSGEGLGLATTVAGWNGVVLLGLIFTAYSYLNAPVDEPIPSDSWIIIAFKALAVAWVIGIILSVYSRVKSAYVQDVETQEQIRILNKTSTVLLALPLLPIALILIMGYFAMKYGNTGTRR
jgi:hypothetical protein